jgi:DNA-directed RNA polymerase subunit M/transcription elongation factor TFIIS
MDKKDRNKFEHTTPNTYYKPFKMTCENCGNEHTLYTQEALNDPEYYTDVLVKCSCGMFVWFSLPVN